MKTVDTLPESEWSNYVSLHPYGNIFQSPEMNRVYRGTKYYEPVLTAVKDNSEIKGVIQGVIIRESGLIRGKLSSRCVVRGGPLVSNVEIVEKLLKSFEDKVEKTVLITQFRNLFDTTHLRENIEAAGFEYEPHLNYLIDLDIGEEYLWNSLSKSREKGIKKAKREGIEVNIVEDKKQLEVLYRLIKATYRRIQIPLADKSLFISAMKNLFDKDMILPLIAYREKKPIAARVALCYMHTIYDWYAGDLLDYRGYHANELLVWEILKHGIKGNYKIFDFGGAGHPDEEYGPREFKRRFGGRMVNFGRYEKVYNPLILSMSEKAYKLYRKYL